VKKLCAYFKISPQGFYKQQKVVEQDAGRDHCVVQLVQAVRAWHRQMGGKKLYHRLYDKIRALPGRLGRDKFFELLARFNLLVRRRRRYARTTDSRHRFHIYTNLAHEFVPTAPHQLWVSDITYVRLQKDRFAYLFLITDAFSRKIIGWELSESLGLEGAINALRRSIRQCPRPQGVIHHSDRGFQYCSHQYTGMLKAKGIQISMAEAGNCYENAMAERVNGILKMEYGLEETFADVKQARKSAKEGIRSYNEERPHWSLNLETPASMHAA